MCLLVPTGRLTKPRYPSNPYLPLTNLFQATLLRQPLILFQLRILFVIEKKILKIFFFFSDLNNVLVLRSNPCQERTRRERLPTCLPAYLLPHYLLTHALQTTLSLLPPLLTTTTTTTTNYLLPITHYLHHHLLLLREPFSPSTISFPHSVAFSISGAFSGALLDTHHKS